MTFKSIDPLLSFNPPSQIWNETPANLILEIQFLFLFAMCTYDAFIRQKNKMYRIAWLESLFCGILIELFTILPETIGNFYHSQFCFMLFGNREPLYMLPGVYVWFLYTFTTSIWHCNLSWKISEYALTVIVIFFIWQPFDLIGIHFQFWTWHNNEPLYAQRNGGVPIASTFWMMSFMSGMQLTLRLIRDTYFLAKRRNLNRIGMVECILFALLASIINITIFMEIPFTFIFFPLTNTTFGLGYSCNYALNIYLYLCIIIVLLQIISGLSYIRIRLNSKSIIYRYIIQILIVYIVISWSMVRFVDIKVDGKFIKQVSFHQKYKVNGENVKQPSFFGIYERDGYVIKNGIDKTRDHYSLDCYDKDLEPEGIRNGDFMEWYGLCLTGLEPQWITYFDTCLILGAALLLITHFVQFSIMPQSFKKMQ